MSNASLQPHPLSNDVFPPPPPPEVPMAQLDAREDDPAALPAVTLQLERLPFVPPFDTGRGFVARLRSRVEEDGFKALLDKAREHGGEWEAGKGFVFEHEEDGQAFLAATGN